MPYLQVDLDALESFHDVGVAAGLSDGDACLGVLRLWRHCWKAKLTHISRDRLATFFPADTDRVVRALVACEFLDGPLEGNQYRVRGAEKRLNVTAARSEAGKQRAAHRGGGGRFTSTDNPQEVHGPSVTTDKPPANAGDLTSKPPANDQLLHPASNIQHQQEDFAGKRRPHAEEPAKDKRLKPLATALEATFRDVRGAKYKHGGAKDAQALKRLLAVATPEEIGARWRLGLLAVGWCSTSTFAQLDSKWNDLASGLKPARKDPQKGATWASDDDWADGGAGFEALNRSPVGGAP